MSEETQTFVDEQISKQSVDAAGGVVDCDPFEDYSYMPVMNDPEPTYIWDPDTDSYYLEQWNSTNPTSKV